LNVTSSRHEVAENVTFGIKQQSFKNGMVSVLASSVVDRGFEPWSGQSKDYKIGICC